MTSMLDTFTELADEVLARANAVLDVSRIVDNDIRRGDVSCLGRNPRRWEVLPADEQHRLPGLIEARNAFADCAKRAIDVGDSRQQKRFVESGGVITHLCAMDEQRSIGAGSWSVDEWREKVIAALQAQLDVLRALPTARKPARRILVADTNTFLTHGTVEDWRLGGQAWTLVAVPQVIRELDDKKLDPRLKDKAQAAIRRFKEYGRRGDTLRGEVKIAGKLSFAEVAIEPDMDWTLDSLRADSADDRLLASTIELMWRELASTVALVTGDRNLQNKARYARVTYLDHDVLKDGVSVG